MNLEQAATEVLTILKQTLDGPNKQAENKLENLQKQRGYGFVLINILSNRSLELGLRQAAGIALKKHAFTNWVGDEVKIEDSEKEQLKQIVVRPEILGDPDSKIRTQLCMVISSIAKFDFPERWPKLLELLVSYITGDNRDLRSSALLSAEFICDYILPADFPHILPQLFPILLRLFTHTGFSVGERNKALNVYRSLVESVLPLQDTDAQLVKTLLRPTIIDWLKAFVTVFEESPDGKDLDDVYSLKDNVNMTLCEFLTTYPQVIKKHLGAIMDSMWRALVNSLPIYQHRMIDDGKVSERGSLESFIDNCCEVLQDISKCDNKAIHDGIIPKFDEIAYMFTYLCQMSHEAVVQFSEDPNAYAAAEEFEDPGNEDWTLRGTGCVSLCTFFDRYEDKFWIPAVVKAAERHLSESVEAQKAGVSIWWKKREAAVAVLGYCGDHLKPNQQFFDVNAIAKQIVCPDLGPQNDNPYLRAKAIWCASHLVDHVTPEIRAILIRGVVHGFADGTPLSVRLAASRAFGMICSHIEEGTFGVEEVNEVLPIALRSYVDLLNHAEGLVLLYTMETFSIVLKVNSQITAAAEPTIIPLIFKAWEKNIEDPSITIDVRTIIYAMAETKECVPQLQKDVLPTMMTILNDHEKHNSGTIEAAIDIIDCLLECNEGVVPDAFLTQILPRLLRIVLSTDDHSVLQAGAKCVASFVNKAAPQITSGSIDGKPTIGLVCEVAAKLLSPEIEDIAAFTVGELVTQLILKIADHIGQKGIQDLLLAVIRRLYTAHYPVLEQSLLMVFARLVHQHGKKIVDFLGEAGEILVRNKKGEQGNLNVVHFIFNKWLEAHKDIQGLYYIKVSLTALVEVLKLRDSRISNIPVQGYIVIDESARRQTRSMGPVEARYTTIPLYSKILSVLVQQWQTKKDDQDGTNADESWEDEYDNDDSFWQDGDALTPRNENSIINQELSEKDFLTLADILDAPCDVDDSELLSMEEKNDPIYKIDLMNFLTSVGKELAKDATLLNQLASHLSQSDQESLKKLLAS